MIMTLVSPEMKDKTDESCGTACFKQRSEEQSKHFSVSAAFTAENWVVKYVACFIFKRFSCSSSFS